MALTVTIEGKNSNLTVTNENKTPDPSRWSERDLSWSDSGAAGDTWQYPGIAITRDTKNNLTVSNENKN